LLPIIPFFLAFAVLGFDTIYIQKRKQLN